MSETERQFGVQLSSDQLPLFSDLLRSQPLAVCLTDTSQPAVLDASWRAWARRSKTFLQSGEGRRYVLAPCYTFPDSAQHERIRQIIAEQLQRVLEIAVFLEATGIWLPIETLVPPFAERMPYYIDILSTLMQQQQLELVLLAGPHCDSPACVALAESLSLPYITSHSDHIPEGKLMTQHPEQTLWIPSHEDSTTIRNMLQTAIARATEVAHESPDTACDTATDHPDTSDDASEADDAGSMTSARSS